MNLGDVGSGCPRCGRGAHDGACRPPDFPPNRVLREGEIPPRRPDGVISTPMPFWLKAFLWVVLACAAAVGFSFLLRMDNAERAEWKAEWLRRTELCEAQGGIPRYAIRGRSYDGCDFPSAVQR